MIEENLYDPTFVENWTHGFDDLRRYVQSFSPEQVAATAWVPADQIHALAQANGCSILMYSGLEYSNSGVQAIRAVWTVQAITGHLDVPGGKLFKMRERLQLNRILTDPPPAAPKPIGAAEYPLYCDVRQEGHAVMLPRTILESEPYPVRALIVSGASLITAWPAPPLAAREPWPLVHIHETDAQARGIADGDAVFVISPRGRVPFRARVTPDIAPGVVEVNMGGGGPTGPKAWQQANVNVLTDFENRDPISGFPVYKALLCDVVKAKE